MMVRHLSRHWTYFCVPIAALGLRLSTHQLLNTGFDLKPFFSLLKIWQGEEPVDFDQNVCNAPYQEDAGDGCDGYRAHTSSKRTSWRSYYTPISRKKCCTPCKFPPPCLQYESVFFSKRVKPYRSVARSALNAVRGATGKKPKPMYFPCCKGPIKKRLNGFQGAMASLIDSLIEAVENHPKGVELAGNLVYKGIIRNYAAYCQKKHFILDAGNVTLESVAKWLKEDYLSLTREAEQASVSLKKAAVVKAKRVAVVLAALNLCITAIHLWGYDLGLMHSLINNLLKGAPDGGCALTLTEIIWPESSAEANHGGTWRSLFTEEGTGCAIGFSVLATVALSQNIPAFSGFKSFSIAAKLVSAGRGLQRFFVAENVKISVDLSRLLDLDVSSQVDIPIVDNRTKRNLKQDVVYLLEAIDGTGVESFTYFTFVPGDDQHSARLHCPWQLPSLLADQIRLAVDKEPGVHELTFRPKRIVEEAHGPLSGLGDVADGVARKIGYDVSSIYFMWYVGYWQFYLVDAAWSTGVNAWNLLQAEWEDKDVVGGADNLQHLLKAEAVLGMLSARERAETISNNGSLSTRVCAEGILRRYIRVFAGQSEGAPADFFREACGTTTRARTGMLLASNTQGLLEAFFGIGPEHLQPHLDKCSSHEAEWNARVQECGLLDMRAIAFNGACCKDIFLYEACSNMIIDNGKLADAIGAIRIFQESLCDFEET